MPVGGGCYAAIFASRGIREPHKGTATRGEWTGAIHRNTPGVWRAPFIYRPGTVCPPLTLVFTCSMSDFWHEGVPAEWRAEALDVIAATPHLTYQILTKRPGNIKRQLADLGRCWPDNAWCGLTIGHPKSLPLLKPLLRIDAPKRFLSVEPLLAPMVPGLDLTGIDWVIGGGESPGPGHPARPCDPAWMRALRDLCLDPGVAFFFKQWGQKSNNPTPWAEELDRAARGGATLDGRLWREFPR